MATHSSMFAWRIPWTEKPGGLWSMGSHRVRHDWVTNTSAFRGFPGGSVVKNLPASAGDMDLSLVQEDPTCLGATKSVCHSYWACAPKPGAAVIEPRCSSCRSPSALEPVLHDRGATAMRSLCTTIRESPSSS